MEKDIDKISKNPDTDIVIRIDDFGGKVGLTIREFVHSDRYTGFTKAGTRIPAEKFEQFKTAINSINESDLKAPEQPEGGDSSDNQAPEQPEGGDSSDNQEKTDSSVEKEGDSSVSSDNIEETAM